MLALADVAVSVTNAQESARWWNEKLGFAVHTVGSAGGHAVMVAPPGDRFVLHLCEGIEPVEPGNTGIAFVTDDLAGWTQRLTAAGVKWVDLPNRRGPGGAPKFQDPDGNIFWLLEVPAEFLQREVGRTAPTGKDESATSRQPPARSH